MDDGVEPMDADEQADAWLFGEAVMAYNILSMYDLPSNALQLHWTHRDSELVVLSEEQIQVMVLPEKLMQGSKSDLMFDERDLSIVCGGLCEMPYDDVCMLGDAENIAVVTSCLKRPGLDLWRPVESSDVLVSARILELDQTLRPSLTLAALPGTPRFAMAWSIDTLHEFDVGHMSGQRAAVPTPALHPAPSPARLVCCKYVSDTAVCMADTRGAGVVYDTRTRTPAMQYTLCDAVAVDACGHTVLALDTSGTLLHYDIRSISQSPVRTALYPHLHTHAHTTHVALAQSHIAVANAGPTAVVDVFSRPDTTNVFQHQGHSFHADSVVALEWHPSAPIVASADSVGELHVWQWDAEASKR